MKHKQISISPLQRTYAVSQGFITPGGMDGGMDGGMASGMDGGIAGEMTGGMASEMTGNDWQNDWRDGG